jgi:hypothetical protein
LKPGGGANFLSPPFFFGAVLYCSPFIPGIFKLPIISPSLSEKSKFAAVGF